MKNRKTARGNRGTPSWAERGNPRWNGVIEAGVVLVSPPISEAAWVWVAEHLRGKLKRCGCLPLASPRQGEGNFVGDYQERLIRHVMERSWSSKPSGVGKSHVLFRAGAFNGSTDSAMPDSSVRSSRESK